MDRHMLNFNPIWRLQPPADDDLHHGIIPQVAIEEFARLIRAIAIGPSRQPTWERFKRKFSAVSGRDFWASTSAHYAEIDGLDRMSDAVNNAPLFIEAFYDGWMEHQTANPIQIPPIVDSVNGIFSRFGIGYQHRSAEPHHVRRAPATRRREYSRCTDNGRKGQKCH